MIDYVPNKSSYAVVVGLGSCSDWASWSKQMVAVIRW